MDASGSFSLAESSKRALVCLSWLPVTNSTPLCKPVLLERKGPYCVRKRQRVNPACLRHFWALHNQLIFNYNHAQHMQCVPGLLSKGLGTRLIHQSPVELWTLSVSLVYPVYQYSSHLLYALLPVCAFLNTWLECLDNKKEWKQKQVIYTCKECKRRQDLIKESEINAGWKFWGINLNGFSSLKWILWPQLHWSIGYVHWLHDTEFKLDQKGREREHCTLVAILQCW